MKSAPHMSLVAGRSRCIRHSFCTSFCAVLVLVCLGGCAAINVTHAPATATTANGSLPGIPFYPKKARCRQEVVWFEPVYTLTLAALVPDKDGALQSHPRGAVVLSRSKFLEPDVNAFMRLLNNPSADVDTLMRGWAKVVALSEASFLSRDFASIASSDRILASRSATPSVYVDYADQYYVNAKVPLSGSANIDAKVADDGTLSEASAQVDNKTLDTILGALPISSVITGGLGLGGKGVAAAGDVETFQLTVSATGYLHTLAKFVEFPKDSKVCPIADDIPLSGANEYKREEMNSPTDNKGATKGDGSDSTTSKDTAPGTPAKKATKPGTKP